MEDLQDLTLEMPPSIADIENGPFGRPVEINEEIQEHVIESLGGLSNFQTQNEDLDGNSFAFLNLVLI